MRKAEAKQKASKKSKFSKAALLTFLGAVIGFLNGFFGGGGGMVCVPTLEKGLGLDNKRAHATAIMVMLPLSIVSASVYVFRGVISSLPLVTVSLGVLAGGICGSIALKFIPSRALRFIFALLMLAGGVRLVI